MTTLLPDNASAPDAPPPTAPTQIVRFGVPRAVRAVRVGLGAVLAVAGLGLAISLASLAGAPPSPQSLWGRALLFGLPGIVVAASGLLTVRDITFDISRKRYRTRRGVLPFVKSDFGDVRDARYVLVGPVAPPAPEAAPSPAPPASDGIVCEVVWDRIGFRRTRLSDTEMRWRRERRVVVTKGNAAQIALRLADALELPLLDARPLAPTAPPDPIASPLP